MEIHVWRPWPEPGVNLDLYQTLDAVHASHQSVTMWGPFVIEKEVYQRSLWVLQIIASGAAAVSGDQLAGGYCSSATASMPSRPSIRSSAAGTTR